MEVERWQSGPDPSISVVLATIPSTDHSDVVEKLKNQSFPREWEIVVVVDNEPTDRRCEARNIGLREAKADIVAHTDDDVSPPEDWLDNIYSAFEADIICVEGPVQGGMDYTGTGLYRGCNMAVRREEALRVGGWDEEYAGWRDDTEFGWRLEEDGHGRCIYADSVVMVHPPAPRTDLRIDQEIELFHRYPDRYRDRLPDSTRKDVFLLLNRSVWGQHLLRALF
ncbi:glycosyltransferase family 2 protein [Halorubrum lipolyticum]|uniref:Family 2 glycosyl transferase n=1 Tax=Halorubrum lipolyticum DSM 21995 TaxID=1227482 RepID=M0NP08_9EURY|nr:glycosyltransferase [Halorubrum lipolyticum]EMA58380.1 family 2 glycosyl transferase [Halorubrum lipolyticum DSM 21995]